MYGPASTPGTVPRKRLDGSVGPGKSDSPASSVAAVPTSSCSPYSWNGTSRSRACQYSSTISAAASALSKAGAAGA